MEFRLDSIDQVVRLGRLVVVFAHPDDEAYLAAGLMTAAASVGLPVTCVTATSGDHAADERGRQLARRVRTGEWNAALDVLGVADRVMLDLGDGRCHLADSAAVVARLAELIADRTPDTVLTFGPDGLTGHLDHQTVSAWTTRAVAAAAPQARLLYVTVTPEMEADEADLCGRYPIYEPGFPCIHPEPRLAVSIELEGELLDRKVMALEAHASQTAWLIDDIGRDRYRDWVRRELFVDASDW